jgi:HAD superfamily hydrolase (TIGR01484 family)
MLSELPIEKIRGVFTDLDDTLTESSRIHATTYEALCRLKDRGLWVAIVSGRPAGWADCLMRLWPLDAMIFENGAGVVTRNGNKLVATSLSETPPHEQRQYLEQRFTELKKQIPTLKLSSDQPFRLYDFAIDYAEEPPTLGEPEVKKILAHLAKYPEVTAKLSSIHINYWYGRHTKVTAVKMLLSTRDCGLNRSEVVFAGDSPNDEPLFEFFEHTVGVANVQSFLKQMRFRPKYVTKNPGGRGFRELVDRLCSVPDKALLD